MDAALDLCAELGYGRVTVEAIAARAGVSKKTIYRWWSSKGADLELALDLLYAPLYYRPLLRLEPATSPERIHAIIDHVIRALNDQK
ncbi:TetR/AcrR family transcriptional regulator [Nonomuraea sp. NPDC050394]|uniref:TetR/AcrR family transcriptional regulator n=1 Tax=Nonomuraea sp. NPDC050394 TaxID=3364363 RepID=UPI00378DDBF0